MIKYILIAIVLVVVGVLTYASSRPDNFKFARSVSIDAPPAAVLPLLNDVKEFTTWSPFEKDPNVKRSFSPETSGVGANYGWNGNKDIGEGTMTITEESDSKIVMDLNFKRPMAARNTAEFEIVERGPQTTEVTWSIYGPMPFMSKLMSVFIDMEAMVGGEFEKGLAKLKTLAEERKAQIRTGKAARVNLCVGGTPDAQLKKLAATHGGAFVSRLTNAPRIAFFDSHEPARFRTGMLKVPGFQPAWQNRSLPEGSQWVCSAVNPETHH